MSVNVIWATGCKQHDTEWEYDWVCELLGDVHRPIQMVSDPQLSELPKDHAVIIFNAKDAQRGDKLSRYIQAYETAQKPYVLIHISDEYYMFFDYSVYGNRMCKAVFRNYWHPAFDRMSHVHTFGLGYKNGFWQDFKGPNPHELDSATRVKAWCFAGKLDMRQPERTQAVYTFMDVRPYTLIEEIGDSFTDRRTGLATNEYRHMFLQSKFALCPVGNINLDTFRLYEALECGCIPVVTKKTQFQNYDPSYWVHVFGQHDIPFIVGD